MDPSLRLEDGAAPSKKKIVCPKIKFDRWTEPVGPYPSFLPAGVDGVGHKLPGGHANQDAMVVTPGVAAVPGVVAASGLGSPVRIESAPDGA